MRHKDKAKSIIFTCFLLIYSNSNLAQSFSDEKVSAINFIKRAYQYSAFEGAKKVEGDERDYFAVSISMTNIASDSILSSVPLAQIKAQNVAEQGFSEPCVKFEMIGHFETSIEKRISYLFLCETLDEFMTNILKKKIFDGVRIISAPNGKYIISAITLENEKYTSAEMQGKVALMKAKQYVNTTINGSTISSEIIIRTDINDDKTEISSTETIREQAVGFIQGLVLLNAREITPNKTTYIYYSKI